VTFSFLCVQSIDRDITFLNRISENKLVYPAGIEELQAKLKWVKDEFDSIFRQNNVEDCQL
jgi:hypothetical protein